MGQEKQYVFRIVGLAKDCCRLAQDRSEWRDFVYALCSSHERRGEVFRTVIIVTATATAARSNWRHF